MLPTLIGGHSFSSCLIFTHSRRMLQGHICVLARNPQKYTLRKWKNSCRLLKTLQMQVWRLPQDSLHACEQGTNRANWFCSCRIPSQASKHIQGWGAPVGLENFLKIISLKCILCFPSALLFKHSFFTYLYVLSLLTIPKVAGTYWGWWSGGPMSIMPWSQVCCLESNNESLWSSLFSLVE